MFPGSNSRKDLLGITEEVKINPVQRVLFIVSRVSKNLTGVEKFWCQPKTKPTEWENRLLGVSFYCLCSWISLTRIASAISSPICKSMADHADASPLVAPSPITEPSEIDLEAGQGEQIQCRICLETDGNFSRFVLLGISQLNLFWFPWFIFEFGIYTMFGCR